jgi:hypothetical protein
MPTTADRLEAIRHDNAADHEAAPWVERAAERTGRQNAAALAAAVRVLERIEATLDASAMTDRAALESLGHFFDLPRGDRSGWGVFPTGTGEFARVHFSGASPCLVSIEGAGDAASTILTLPRLAQALAAWTRRY